MKKTVIICSEDKLSIIEKSSINIFQYSDIAGVFYEHPYLKIITVNKNKKLIFYSLKEISKLLPPQFVVCSRSAIINLTHVAQFKSGNSNCFIELDNGEKIPVSRRKKSEIMEKMKMIYTEL